MLDTYTEYIDRYLNKLGLGDKPCPGEHHFVSSYLVPRLFALNQRVPDYINPDGMKGIIGDVAYYKGQDYQLCIEVKLGTIRLTKREFNEWIVADDSSRLPHMFIGICLDGIVICSWNDFRLAYIKSVKKRNVKWEPKTIAKGYGPSKAVNLILEYLGKSKYFKKGDTLKESKELERKFIDALKNEIDCNKANSVDTISCTAEYWAPLK
ncbi:hypothetical protein KAR48_16285 [bacterium]|nr:hypothetical protein [bacterium]